MTMWMVRATAALARMHMASLRASHAAFEIAAGIALQSLREPELDALASTIYDASGLHRSERVEEWEERWWSAALALPPATPTKPGHILVAGCGAGRELQWLSERGWRVSAFDPAPSLVALARQRVPRARIEVADFATFIRSRAAVHGARDAQDAHTGGHLEAFDAVLIGFGAFSHCLTRTSRRDLLDACARVCPDGPILLSWQASGGHTLRASRARRIGDRVGGALGALRGIVETRDDLVLLPHAGPTALLTMRDVEELATGLGRSLVGGEAPMPHGALVVRRSGTATRDAAAGGRPGSRKKAARQIRARTHADLAEVAIDLLEDVLRERGAHRLVARGGSMRPAIRHGATLLLRACERDAAAISLGDVVAARVHGALVVHRVVGKDARGAVLLRGDGCPAPDGWVSPRDVLGVVVSADGGSVPPPLRTTSAQRAQITQLKEVLRNALRKMSR